jgi:hypothetical protein
MKKYEETTNPNNRISNSAITQPISNNASQSKTAHANANPNTLTYRNS